MSRQRSGLRMSVLQEKGIGSILESGTDALVSSYIVFNLLSFPGDPA